METKNEANGLLKVSAILMIVFAVIGVVVMLIMAGQLAAGMIENTNQLIDTGGEMVRAGTILMWMQAAMLAAAVIAAIPRLIAGITGLSRCAKPEKHDFFVAWGITLLVLGVIGLLFSGWVLSANWLASFAGGVIIPTLYIIGGLQQKSRYIAQKSAEPIVRELNYPTAEDVSEPDDPAESGTALPTNETAK